MPREFLRTILLLLVTLLFFREASAQCIVVTDATAYTEDFEASNGNWVSGGGGNDWAWGSPAKATITGAGGGKNCWITGGLTGSSYSNNESSYLLSPCFDFTNVTNPYIKFKVFWETEYNYDGASLEYSLDKGASWQNVGAVNEAANCLNANWFNTPSIRYLSGLGPTQQGWSGAVHNSGCGGNTNGSGGWVTASHEMTTLAGKANVMFRFTFGAGTRCNSFDGFAVDDIAISNAPPNGSVDFVPNCISSLEVGFTNNSSPCFVSYVWNFGDAASGPNNTSATFNPKHIFSAPGNYTVTLTATGSTGPPITVTRQVHIMIVTASIIQSPTCGKSNGSIKAMVAADPLVTGISYTWNTTPVTNTATVMGLSAGAYIVTATAANACTANDTITLAGSLPLNHTISSINTTCGLNNGNIIVTESGGTPAYKYIWQPAVSNTGIANNLAPNTYTVMIADNAGCKDTITTIISQLSKALTHTVSSTNISCTVAAGSASITESGGTQPLTYLWSPAVSTSSSASGLAVGNYVVNINDNGACTDSVHIQIINTSTNSVGIGSIKNVTCFGGSDGSATAISTGIKPVTYIWSPSGGNNATATNLGAGTYTVTSTDAKGCAVSTTAQVTQPTTPISIAINSTTGCGNNTGKAWATVTNGNAPYQYLWSDGSTGDTAYNLAIGSVTVNVTDAKGCMQSAPGIVQPFVPVKISLGNDTIICPGNVVKLYPGVFSSYLWQDNSTSPVYNASATGTYSVEVTDSNGCTGFGSVNVNTTCQDILFPNAFTPNGDGHNDGFGPGGTLSAVSGYTLKVFNRYGQLVFTSNNPYKKWPGTTKGVDGDSDVFVWIAQYSFNGEKRKAVKGSVLLVR